MAVSLEHTAVNLYCVIPNIPWYAKWTRNGVTVAGGNGNNDATNQLHVPQGLFVDDDQTLVIADTDNYRIVQWKMGDTKGQLLAGGRGRGNRLDQLDHPVDVLSDKETNSLIICDHRIRRVVRWSRRSGTTQGEILIDNTTCRGLAMDNYGYLYVSDAEKMEVRRYKLGEKNGTLVAGGNGQGDGLNKLNEPRLLFVDRQQNVYVSDNYDHRVMKWNKDATEGIVVAGGQGNGSALTQLHHPFGLFVDQMDTLYVAEYSNNRVMRWPQGAKQGTVIVGGNGAGAGANQLNHPIVAPSSFLTYCEEIFNMTTSISEMTRGAALEARWNRYKALPQKTQPAVESVCGKLVQPTCQKLIGRPTDTETESCDKSCCHAGYLTGFCKGTITVDGIINLVGPGQTEYKPKINARSGCVCTNDQRDATCGPDGSFAGIRCPFDTSACARKCCREGRSGARCGGFLKTKCKCN
ncbi:unnamed protein product [Rotaria magnacalcarata]|uniref:Invertebrate defensins family profile domain-containing protein n=1 Tax=Rotaria magnacalcarata TaxID=392030 RepID=A0A819LZ99_9BILA|nr:unnamed protein product [Rotaria magnacalcarata]